MRTENSGIAPLDAKMPAPSPVVPSAASTTTTTTANVGALLPAMPPGYPRPFGNYVLLTPLAAGGMGEVFLASSTIAGAVRLIVIKTLRPDLVKEAGYVRRFQDEARIALELSHKNVSQVFDVGIVDGVHYIAMEHIAGATLRHIIEAANNALPAPAALLIAIEVLEGLASAHAHKHPLTGEPRPVVHRDVSPHNVMVSYDGDVKLIDFGLAWSETKTERTGTEVVLGKIAYMSPEQSRGDKVDGRSDQYSLAIVLYELLAGERFYGLMTQREVWQIAGNTPHRPKHFDALTPDLRAVVERALSFEPADRFATCTDFADALRVVLRERHGGADKAVLRTLVAELLRDERAESEMSLRHIAPLALSAISSSSSSRPFGAVPPTIATVHDVEPSIPETTAALAHKATSNAVPRIAAVGVAAIVVGAIALLVHSAGATPTVATTPPTAPIVAPIVEKPAPVAAAIVEDAKPVEADPPIEPMDAAPKPKSIASSPKAHAKLDKPAPTTTTPTPAAKASATTLAADWRGWPMERKVKELEKSDAFCARTLLKLRSKGSELQPGAVDACLATL